jgi:outer membrane protein TolC
VLICAASAFGQSDSASQGQAPTLRGLSGLPLTTVQSMALRQNPEVLQAELEVNKTTAHLKSIIAQRYPKLLALTFIGQQVTSNYVRNLAVLPGVFQPITQQYRLGMEVRDAALAVRVSQQRLRLSKQQTVAEVKKLYFSMLALQSAVASLQTNFDFLKELSRYVQAQVKRGSTLSVDSLVVQARVAKADFELAKAKDDLETMGQNLNRLIGRGAKEPVNLVDEPMLQVSENQEDVQVAQAMASRPELNAIKLDIHRFNLQEKISLSGYIPDISFGSTAIVSKNFDITFPRNFVSMGFLATWEPWDWGRRIQIGKESLSQMQQQRIKLRDFSEAVTIDVDKSRRDVKLADKEAYAGALAEESSKEQLRVVHRRFLAGAALLKDVMEAQNLYTTAITENVKAKTDVAVARVELDLALGKDF